MLHRIQSWPTNNGTGPPVALTIWRDPDGGIYLGITHGGTQLVLMAIPPEERAALAVAILAGGPRMEPST